MNKQFNSGDTLPNGALVIETRGDKVLARWHEQFVTWVMCPEGYCYWGHYFSDLGEAVQDFQTR